MYFERKKNFCDENEKSGFRTTLRLSTDIDKIFVCRYGI